MLYVSSRNKTDSFTAHRTLCEDRAPDGGLFIPYQLPIIDDTQLRKMCEREFGDNVSYILNLFFSKKIAAWDVACSVGRSPLSVSPMSHRILTAECYHNPENTYKYLERKLFRLLNSEAPGAVTSWVRIAIRIAILFALHAMLPETERKSYDIAVMTGDFSAPMAAWYARKMGLPIGKIICCCNDNSAAWDLIQRGEFNTGLQLVSTGMQDADYSCPQEIERLVYHTLGVDEVNAYNTVCNKKGVYHLVDDAFIQLGDGLVASVVGRDRVSDTIRSVYRTNQYFVSPKTAILYGGLQDYRARSGVSRYSLIMAEDSPSLYADHVCNICSVEKPDLLKAVSN